MVKVLYVITGLGKGGAERQLYYLIKNLPKGYEAKVCAFVDGYFSEKIRSLGIEVRIFKGGLSAFGEFRAVLGEFKPDIVHSWLTHANLFCKINNIFRRYTLICSMRGIEYGVAWHRLLSGTERLFDFGCSMLITNSNSFKEELISKWKYNQKKLKVVYNAYIPSEELGINILKELNLKSKYLVVTVANFRSGKDYPTTVKTAKEVLRHKKDTHFLFVGEGPKRGEIEKMVESEGLGNNIHFLGVRNDVPAILARSAVMFLPTLYEAQSNVIIEAMFSKCPIVTTNIPANSELLTEGKEGFLLESGDFKEMAERIIYLLQNKKIAKEMRENAYQKAKKIFLLENTIMMYIRSYADLILEFPVFLTRGSSLKK